MRRRASRSLYLSEGDISDNRSEAKVFVLSVMALPTSRCSLFEGGISSLGPKDDTEEGQALILFNLEIFGRGSGGPRPSSSNTSLGVHCKHINLQHASSVLEVSLAGSDSCGVEGGVDTVLVGPGRVVIFEADGRTFEGGRIGR
jgi:hypothetical protein